MSDERSRNKRRNKKEKKERCLFLSLQECVIVVVVVVVCVCVCVCVFYYVHNMTTLVSCFPTQPPTQSVEKNNKKITNLSFFFTAERVKTQSHLVHSMAEDLVQRSPLSPATPTPQAC